MKKTLFFLLLTLALSSCAQESPNETDLSKQKPPCPCEVYSENWQKHNDSVLNRLKPGQKIRLVPQGTGEPGHIYVTRFVDCDSCIGTVTERIEVELK